MLLLNACRAGNFAENENFRLTKCWNTGKSDIFIFGEGLSALEHV
jgi:hypothetical protein